MKKIFKFLVVLLVIYVISAVAFCGYTFIDDIEGNDGEFDFFRPAREIYNLVGGIPDKTNFVIFGVDEGRTRTDTIIAGCFDESDCSVKMVSIPRDTVVTVSKDSFKKMNEGYPEPGDRTMKLNTVYHFSKEEYGADLAVEQVEEIIGEEIDYYCIVDFEALNYIVDEIGGVDFYVPCDMYYSDPYQDLYIELYEGQQILNGDQAEQLLRFRSGYANADLGRVEVQQDFMIEFLMQIMSKENITRNFTDYIKAASEYIETDMPVSRAVRYAVAVKDIKTENISSCTIPGEAGFVKGISGFVISDESDVLDEIFR